MGFLEILKNCPEGMGTLVGIVKLFLNGVRYVIPIILIVIGTVDLAKAVLAKDDEATKKEQKHLVTRVIYAVVIFLIPTIVIVLFNVLGKSTTDDYNAESGFSWKTWSDCWNNPTTTTP